MHLTELFDKCNEDSFEKIAQSTINIMCGIATINVNSSILTEQECALLIQAIRTAVESILKYSLNSSQIPSDEWAGAGEKFVNIIHKTLDENPSKTRLLKLNLILGRSGPHLTNYDTNVKWILGSSSLSSLEEPLASLELQLSDGSKHTIEMNKSELDQLITVLEKK